MKKFSSILFVLAIFIMNSCTGILDVQPTQSISADEAIKDKTGVDRAITGAYSGLQQTGCYGRNLVIVGDLPTDILAWTGTTMDYAQINNNVIPSDNGVIDGIWAANFDVINRVNNVLYRMPEISDMTPEEYGMYEGDGLFIRALCYYNLVNLFGGVPLKILPTLDLSNIDQARASVDEVYAQIVADLTTAKASLPKSRALGYANAYSANALLARVYLAMYHLNNDPAYAQMAIDEANTVIGDGGFSLAVPYSALFNGNGTESVFEIIYDAQNSNRLAQYYFPRSLTGRYEVSPTPEYVANYPVEDSMRFTATIAFDENNLPYNIKYKDITAGTDRVYVLRLAEMYLIRAEALAYTGGSIEEIQSNINVVRNRAGVAPTQANDYPALKAAILNEMQQEFAYEGHRWFDLKRTKTATTILGIDEKQTLFPIPLYEMQTNKKMTQNPGY